MNNMPPYWWECEKCEQTYYFEDVTSSNTIVKFIWDELLTSAWSQELLQKECNKCKENKLRISYHFPSKDNLKLRVVHIVGLELENEYLPMMWETYFTHNPSENVFDFKYLNGRNIWGLNKPAVLSKGELSQIFALYSKRTGNKSFP
ncbi:MAG: hypothetical protein IH875_10945 [Candidatus Dadabacteria bacterium]|nr:hypothetical protein [Candidatus Dadabacteria bacterium]